MRNICAILSGLIIFFNATAQNIRTKQSVKLIVQEREIYLNGGARASVGGKSRTTIPITLPENTTSWYYSFSTSPGQSGTKNLNLFVQMSALAISPLSKSIISNVEVPEGSESIDVYLLDQQNSDLFLAKVDNDGGQFFYKREGSVFNTRQAVVDINSNNTGTYYIGLKNPSSLDGIDIHIEVVAIVQEIEQETEEQSEGITMGNLGWKAFERGDYDKCIELSKKALALDNTLGFVHFNIALSYLIKGQNADATEGYSKAIAVTKKTSIPKQTFLGAINDLQSNMEKFPSKNDAQDILDLLKEEAKNYN